MESAAGRERGRLGDRGMERRGEFPKCSSLYLPVSPSLYLSVPQSPSPSLRYAGTVLRPDAV